MYIMDMRNLQEKALDVYNDFLRGNHTVSRSTSQSFNQVWTDMALEQSINLGSKTKGGIIGIQALFRNGFGQHTREQQPRLLPKE